MKKYYYDYDFYNEKSGEKFHLVEKFKPILQELDNSCGPVCVKMILEHYGQKINLSESELCQIFKTRAWPFGTKLKELIFGIKKLCKNDIVSSLDKRRSPKKKEFAEFEDFKAFALEWLDKGVPIILENVDCGGHYRVLIGWDEDENSQTKDMLIFADPGDLYDGVSDGYNYFPAERFFYMWFDSHCLRKCERMQPYVIILPNSEE